MGGLSLVSNTCWHTLSFLAQDYLVQRHPHSLPPVVSTAPSPHHSETFPRLAGCATAVLSDPSNLSAHCHPPPPYPPTLPSLPPPWQLPPLPCVVDPVCIPLTDAPVGLQRTRVIMPFSITSTSSSSAFHSCSWVSSGTNSCQLSGIFMSTLVQTIYPWRAGNLWAGIRRANVGEGTTSTLVLSWGAPSSSTIGPSSLFCYSQNLRYGCRSVPSKSASGACFCTSTTVV